MIWLDDETYSPEPITNGTHKYAESCEILIRALALDDGPVAVFDLTPGGRTWLLSGDDLTAPDTVYELQLMRALADEKQEIWIHNSHFDRTVERHAGLDLPLQRVRDTMVQALAHSLPGSLGALCEVLKVPTDKAKDKAGKQLIQLFCKPPGANLKRGRATRETHPAEWNRFLLYAGLDIVAMRECYKRMPKWNYPANARELDLWRLDQQINDRGVPIDLHLAESAVAAVDLAQVGLRERTQEITDGEVPSTTQVDVLLEHILAQYGVDLPDMQKATLERRLADESLPDGLRELLRIRLQASSTSTSKYKVLLRATSSDGRLRGLLQFNGAARTGRWAGRLFQPQNLPSRGLLPHDDIMAGIEALKDGCAHLLFDNVMHLTSSAIRGCVVASPGHKLVVADLSNIEGRDQAWLAGERWKLQAFRDFDAGVGPDLYKMSYGKSFNVAPDQVTKDQRQIGKVQELALGYEGGVGAFVTFAAAYGIDLDDLADKAVKFIPGDVMGQAQIMLQWHRAKGRDPAGRLQMADKTWLVCESFKLGWRAGHKEIAAYWKYLDAVVREAIEHPGRTLQCGKVKVRRDGAWLRIVLPSGRALCYPSPALMPERKQRDAEEVLGLEAVESEPTTGRTKITYLGMNQYTRKWSRLDTYGGKLFENCLTGDTEVLTMVGWRRLDVVNDLPVWDGHEWVEHDGCVYKGKQVVLTAYGVQMTPDHLVLTEQGWRNASSCEGIDRAEVGLPDGYSLHRIGERAPVYLGSEVHLRCFEDYASLGIPQAAEARGRSLLRVHASSEHCGGAHDAWNESASGVCGVAQYVRPMPSDDAPGVQKLWRAGYHGVRTLAQIVRNLLGRYGSDVRNRTQHRASEEQLRLFPGELPMGDTTSTVQQPAHERAARDATGKNHPLAGSPALRHRPKHAGLANQERLVDGEGARPVYDLMNCGPRHQFVVRGGDGHALIVHNCCQAVARDVMAHNMPAIEAAGYKIILTVHDEILAEAPDRPEFNAEHLSSLLAANPPWAEDMPLAAAGFEAYRYKKD